MTRARRLAAAGLVAAGLAGAGGAWAYAGADLRLAGTPTFTGAAVATVPGYGARGTHVVDYRHGAVLRLSLPVRNTGSVPLTLVEVAPLHTGPDLLTPQPVAPGTAVPAGATRVVTVDLQLGECRFFHERETRSYDGLVLRVRLGGPLGPLGRVVEREVALDRPLLVHSPMIVGCPDRLLDRSAVNRRDVRS